MSTEPFWFMVIEALVSARNPVMAHCGCNQAGVRQKAVSGDAVQV
jgi:hypothetical protein